MILENPTDEEIDCLIAEHLLGWKWYFNSTIAPRRKFLKSPDYNYPHAVLADEDVEREESTAENGGGYARFVPKFSRSFDLISPVLSDHGIWDASFLGGELYRITVWDKEGHRSEANTIAKAAAISLLSMHRIYVKYTK